MDTPAGHPRPILVGVVLSAAALASFVVHAPFVLDGFGEGDAARIVNQAAGWHAAGHLTIHEYTARISPLYLHALKLLLDAGIPLRLMPAVMNWTNAAVGSLTLIPLYIFFRQLAGGRAAVVGCVLYSFAPAFWQAQLYGMPHLPSFAFFVTAAALFHSTLDLETRRASPRFVGAAVCMAVGCALKADVVLCTPGLAMLALLHRRHRWRNFIAAGAIVATGAAFTLLYSHVIVAPMSGSATSEADNWGRRFPWTLHALRDAWNRNRTILAIGPVLCAAAAGAVLVAAMKKKCHGLLLVCLAWALPSILFWGLKMGNSPRHLMAGYSLLVLLVGAIAADLLRRRWLLGAAVSVLLLANYFSGRPNSETLNPSPRLLGSVDRFQYRVGYTTNPYVMFETLAASSEYHLRGHDLALEADVVNAGGQHQHVRVEHLWEVPARVRSRPGWVIWWFEAPVTVLDAEDPNTPARDSTTPPPGRTLPVEPVEFGG